MVRILAPWEKKIHHSSEKYIFGHLVSPHLVPLCVTLAADLLRLLITQREKKRRKFVSSPADRHGANIARPWKTTPALVRHQLNRQLRADFIVPSGPLHEGQGEAEGTLPV